MDRWILFEHRLHFATPWPYEQPWEQWTAAGRPPAAAEGVSRAFGRVSPRDAQEAVTVPVDLPRPVPNGAYAVAVHHDEHWLYVLLWSQPGPPAEGLEGETRNAAALTIASADQRFVDIYERGADGARTARSQPTSYGPRATPPPRRGVHWNFAECDIGVAGVGDGRWHCQTWRISRADEHQAMDGETLLMSVSRLDFASIEAVAWGAHHVWSVRTEEMMRVRLVNRPRPEAWPVAQRVVLHRDAVADTGQIEVDWQRPHEQHEQFTALDVGQRRTVQWDHYAVRINGVETVLPCTGKERATVHGLRPGVNDVQIVAPGSPALRLPLDFHTGHRVEPCDFPHPPAIDAALVSQRMEAEVAELLAARKRRIEAGQPLRFRPWNTFVAASLGRAHHYFGFDDEVLELVREEADYALSLQRPDGTYAGNHLMAGPGGARNEVRWRGGAYDTGQAGELWVVAHRLLGDEKYIEASAALVKAYDGYRVEFNHNYASFAIWHLVAHYHATGDHDALDRAKWYARYAVGVDMLPCGFQSGHNYYTAYGAITLRGLALLANALPDDDPMTPDIREKTLRMTNGLLSRLQPSGLFDGRDRCYMGFRMRIWTPLLAAFFASAQDVAELDRLAARLLAAEDQPECVSFERLSSSDFVQYWAHREKLLSGERVAAKDVL